MLVSVTLRNQPLLGSSRMLIMSAVKRMLSQERFDELFGATIAGLETWELTDALLLMEEAVALRLGMITIRKSRKRNKQRAKKQSESRVEPMVEVRQERRLKNAVKRLANRDEPREDRQSYQEYLDSAEWYGIRQRILKRDGYLCVACGNHARDVHHRDYHEQTMRGRRLHKLVSLCAACHQHVHFVNGEKQSSEIVDERLIELVIQHGRVEQLHERVRRDF